VIFHTCHQPFEEVDFFKTIKSVILDVQLTCIGRCGRIWSDNTIQSFQKLNEGMLS